MQGGEVYMCDFRVLLHERKKRELATGSGLKSLNVHDRTGAICSFFDAGCRESSRRKSPRGCCDEPTKHDRSFYERMKKRTKTLQTRIQTNIMDSKYLPE